MIADLYMRYALLSKFLFIITRISLSRSKITRIIIMLFIIFMQNLYEKFYNKKKRVIFILNKILDFSIKQHTIR